MKRQYWRPAPSQNWAAACAKVHWGCWPSSYLICCCVIQHVYSLKIKPWPGHYQLGKNNFLTLVKNSTKATCIIHNSYVAPSPSPSPFPLPPPPSPPPKKKKTGISLFQYWWNYKHHVDNAEPFSGLVSSIFFCLPALLGRVKDFVTMGCLLLAADFLGSKNFLLSQNKQNYIFYNIQGVKFLFFRGIALL